MHPYWIGKLDEEEGTRLHVYDDKTGEAVVPGHVMQGHPTIGQGRALDVQGITANESLMLLGNDLERIEKQCTNAFPKFGELTPGRQFVLTTMAYNMGWEGMLSFHVMLADVWAGNYAAAGIALMSSEVARQLPSRYRFLCYVMRTGSDAGYSVA